ncbi:MAG TPA: ricin-type beta-trefoil lectin domain protein [Actinocrinis sp.]|nr:ricin-type beta-trefoil lectin domain protein [Actinocrinis sp.]
MKKTAVVPALALATALAGVFAGAPALAAGPVAAPAGAARAAAPAFAEQAVPLRLEPLGDSITFGTASSTGNGYRQPLWNALTGEGYALNFVGSVSSGTMADDHNEGHPGLRIDQISGLTDSSLATYKPNIITLMAGTNDMVQNFQESTAPNRLSSLIDQILADDPSATLLVANLIIGTNSNIAAGEPAYNATIPGIVQSKQTAGKHVVFVNMSALTASDLAPDGIHPNDTGYQLMANAWNTGVQTATSNGWITAPVGLGTGASAAGPTGESVSGITGDCADAKASSTANGTAVQLYTCNHTSAQTWTAYSDGSLRVLGKCLDATGAGTADGTKAELWDCNGGGNQVWQAYNGGYLNPASGKCLDDTGGSTTVGTQLELWDCNGTPAQLWGPPGLGPVASGLAGKCLDDNAGSNVNGAKADIWDCNGSAAQAWSYTGGTLQINGLCLDVVGGQTADGSLVDLWGCNSGTNQVWNVVNGELQNPASGKCLDDPGLNVTNGTQLDIWDCNGGANQQWALPTT